MPINYHQSLYSNLFGTHEDNQLQICAIIATPAPKRLEQGKGMGKENMYTKMSGEIENEFLSKFKHELKQAASQLSHLASHQGKHSTP